VFYYVCGAGSLVQMSTDSLTEHDYFLAHVLLRMRKFPRFLLFSHLYKDDVCSCGFFDVSCERTVAKKGNDRRSG
jgi:hypothetical protein